MRITRWGEYGILCCLYLAERAGESPVGAAEIAEHQGIPLQYAQQILHRLRKGGVISSVRGPRGGFRLSKSPQETSLRAILYAAEGRTFEVICETDPVYEDSCCTASDCGLRTVWQDLQAAINEVLESRSLASVMAQRADADGRPQALVPGPRGPRSAVRSGNETAKSDL